MIGTSQRQVFVQSPVFIPDAIIAEALKVAAFSGVDVRVMISARASGTPLPEWAGDTNFADIVAAGVRVYLYEKGYLHAMTISVDSEVCSIGSANIDIRSFSINYELNAVVYDSDLANNWRPSSNTISPRAVHSIRWCINNAAESSISETRLQDSSRRYLWTNPTSH